MIPQRSQTFVKVLLKTDALQHINTPQTESDSELVDTTLAGRHGSPLVDAYQYLRARVVDVQAVAELGWTPLGCAASIGQFVELIEILVEAGARLESTAGDATSLQVAARHDVSGGEVVRYLSQNRADVNAIGGKFGSVLLATLERPCSFVLDNNHSIRMEDDPQPQIIDFLLAFLKRGLDLNLVPEGHQSPLQVAAQNNLPLVVSFLLEHGAKLPSFNNKTRPLCSPDQSENPSMTRAILQTSILSHLQPYHHEVFCVLLNQGVPPDADEIGFGGDLGMTVLGAACTSASEDYLRTATLLLEHGADPNFRDTRGHLSIQRAAYAVSLGHLQKLDDYGACVQTDDNEYGSLLHSLCRGYARQLEIQRNSQAFIDCFKFLDQRLPRQSVWKQDSDGRNCLHYLANLAEETRLAVRPDRTLSHVKSPVIYILQVFLNLHGNPYPLGRVPNPPLEVFLTLDLNG
ncbi:hypothetical protein G7Y89_g5497 [Cudoniella acicularis]|uniref:Ankyrin n=1 Tax=Cudoniella acicularis TaxID=354080 RepID=A0A8H4RMD9_9HELO|nr:hypothetical protein G7Y89_g5497 [Cudoniella acicularis]